MRVSFGRYPLQRRPDTRAMPPRLLAPPRKEISIAERFREIGIQKRGNAPIRSLMIPEPYRAISSTYTPSRNASTARPGEHRVGRAVTPPRAAVFEWIKRRKRRFFAEAPTW